MGNTDRCMAHLYEKYMSHHADHLNVQKTFTWGLWQSQMSISGIAATHGDVIS